MLRFVCWVWLGMILGVSFLAAPAKFMAESLTLPVALDVGRVTFGLFDRLEWLWVAALSFAIHRRWRAGRVDRVMARLVAAILAIVVVQSFYFLPALDARVALIIAGETPPPSHLHTVSGAFEVLQSIALIWLGLRATDGDPPADR